MKEFLEDTWRGLNASPKHLESKYFYDETGDALFREIMRCPEYYLTDCELEIFSQQCNDLLDTLLAYADVFDVAELGAGDCTKSVHLLQALLGRGVEFTYYPIDISGNIIKLLKSELPRQLPGIHLYGLNGDYFEMLEQLKRYSTRNKIVLFLGSSIGNIPMRKTVEFFKELRERMKPGDLLLTGFDLKKDPQVILNAYNDHTGITRKFNLNHLQRINRLLSADFDIEQFEHSPVYNEDTGTCESYLVSKKDQCVHIGEAGCVNFIKGERIHMEVSQKYTVNQTDSIALLAGFEPVHHFYDSKNWFLDALWQYP